MSTRDEVISSLEKIKVSIQELMKKAPDESEYFIQALKQAESRIGMALDEYEHLHKLKKYSRASMSIQT